MPAWMVKLGIQVVKDPDKAVKYLFIGMMLLMLALFMMLAPFYMLFIPAASEQEVNYYVKAANQIQQETGQTVNWQEIMAIDAVVYEQDFSKTSQDHAYSYKGKFVWSEQEEYPCSGEDDQGNTVEKTCTRTIYHTRSLSDVMTRMGLSDDQKESVHRYLYVDLRSETTAVATADVANWVKSAIQILHEKAPEIDDSWESYMETLVMKESSGNPNIENPTPVYYSPKDGYQHAQGLCQVMPPTFRDYHIKGHDDIWNPVDNTIAAMLYIKARYGNVENIPGILYGDYKGY